MRLTSAYDLKRELVEGIVVPFTAVAGRQAIRARRAAPGLARDFAIASPLAVSAKPVDEVATVQRSVALGIARKGKEYHLAVRVQRPSLVASPLVEHITAEAKGEVDVRLIGRIDKRDKRTPAAALNEPWFRQRIRPLLIGSSVGHVRVTAGTIGAFVQRDGKTFILSNNHVLADENRGKNGDAVVQQGTIDGGKDPDDTVAALRRMVRLKKSGANVVDAALAGVANGIDFDARLLRGILAGQDRQLAGLGPEFVDEGTVVHKVGRTTGATEGRVTAFDVDNVVVAYDSGNLRFDNQIEIEGVGNAAFSDGGDSGSGIVDGEMGIVALLFAGGDTGGSNGLGLTYANPIRTVLSSLGATLLP